MHLLNVITVLPVVFLMQPVFSAASCDTLYSGGQTTAQQYTMTLPGVGSSSVYCPMDDMPNGVASCKAYEDSGTTSDGLYWVSPTGAGSGMAVYCDFSATEFVNDVILMEFGHDVETYTDVSGSYSGAGSYTVSLTYDYASVSALSVLAQNVLRCEQKLNISCDDIKIWNSGTQYTWWEDASGAQMTSFPGADAADTGCFCGQNQNCDPSDGSVLCNCDRAYIGKEGGYITDTAVLPISALKMGGFTTSEATASHSIGKLRCYDADTSTIPTSCLDANENYGHTQTGYYLLDPDGSSGSMLPVKVYCDMDGVENAVMTVFEHDVTEFTVVKITGSGNYGVDVNYNGLSFEQVASLMSGAVRCEQYISFSCYKGTRIRKSDRAWWSGRDGTKQTYWGGAEGNSDKCLCGVLDVCLASEGCNCDSQDTLNLLGDHGYLTDMSALPVSQVRMADTGGQKEATFSLGSLRCYHQTAAVIWPSCYHVLTFDTTVDGDYLIDPDNPNNGLDPFRVTCDMDFNSTHASQTFDHDAEDRTQVTGFTTAGGYARDISYYASWDQFAALFALGNVQDCEQYIEYDCNAAKLLDSDTSWWVSRTGTTMRHWGGAVDGDASCACGLTGSCAGGGVCNCDQGAGSWDTDSGDLVDKTHLPVAQLRIGSDSGEVYYTLGKLVCYIAAAPSPCQMTPCFHGGACDDGEGTLDTFTCDCSGTGYTGTHCSEDEDECTMGTDNCHASLATCINLPGTFNCSCIAGYTGNGVTCSDVDECSNGDEDCVGLSTCVNTVGSFTCSCNSGYTGDGRTSGTGCSDIDECSLGTDDCDAAKSTCNNTVGAFVCNCKDGYQDDDNDNACEDFDECTAGVDDCEALATCTNTEGSFTCPCNAGYDGDGTTGGTGCSDVDECSLGTDSCLATTSTCVNAVGSYTCTCKTGFNDDDGDNSCEDTNECSAGTDNCHASLGVCTNNFGSFSCSCIVGYSGDGVSSCSDIDECGTGSDSCDASISSCTNSIGSYVCNCDAGYQDDDGDNSCADDDECSKGSDNCHSTLGACTNTVGSFTCACDTGYEGDGVSFCTDIDECTVGHSCHTTYGICTNTAGSYTCACRNGFAGNGFTCAEIDECTGITCSHRGSCIDKVGYYKCECDYGYWGTDCEYSFFYVNTVQMTAGSLYWPFDNVTASNTYMDSQLGTPGQAGNTAPNDYGISGMSVMLQENGTSDCIDFGDFDSDCISDTGLCTEGLSASIWVRFTESQIKESDSKYIVSSGPPDSTGFSIYKENNKFYVVVNNGTYNWEVRVQNQIPADLWTNIGFSWHWQHGLDVTVDANSVGTDPTGTQSMSPDVVDKLTVGCRFNTASLTEHVSGLLDEFAVWPLFTNSTDYVKLMGGLDIDDCVTEPCVYGDCYDVGLAAYQCECNPGYNGTDCEIEIDECASNPCANGGTCSDLIAAFSCECTFGFTGDFCDLDLTPNYDFSQVVDLSPGFLSTTPETNPYYILAPFIWQLNTGGGSLTITGSNFTIVAGRQNVGLYVQIGADDTWVDLGDYPNHCIGLPRECVDGISVSLWLKIDSRVKDTTPAFLMYSGAANQGGRVGLAIMITNANALLLQVVDGYNEVKSASIPESSVPWDQWANVAFNWDVTDGTQAFINGRLVADAVRVTESSGDYNSDNLLTLGTQYNSLNSGFPVAYSDVVIWNRRLNDFEAHRFLGMTRREYALVTNANYFWSTDSWVRKDHLTVSEYDAFFNNTAGGLNLPGDGAVLLMPGRDEKGNSILILGCCDQWLYMGDFAGECVSNPSLCTEGLSVSLWVQLSEIQDNTTHFLISSGEQVTMGFSIYQRGDYETGSKLGAALTDGNYRWVLEIPYQPYVTEANTTEGYFEFSDWVNLGLTWSDRTGLHLYIDGIQYAADFTGYRKIRPEDFETRLILGRRNDFLDNDSNFTFEEFAVFERELKPYELRELFGLTENLNYKDATYHWDTHGLITSDYFIMANNAPDPSMGFIGPNEYVEIVDDDTIELTGQQADIILGNFTGACISDPSYCDAGLTVSFWINFAYTTSGTAYLLSSGAQASSRGFAVFRQAAILKFMINDGSEKINALYDINDIPNGEWCNLAFTWHRYLGFTAYLNANEMSPTSIGTLSGSNTDDHTLLLLGRRNDAESQYADFKIHSLVIWHEYTYSRQIHRLLGISEIEKYHYDKADYIWTFETPTSLYFSGTYSSSGISYIADRHSIGKAICTDGSTGYMQFGHITCLSNPSTCNNGFAVAMWIKLRDIPSSQGHLVSVGAQEEDEKGFVVTQKPSLIEVIVGDGSRQWKVEIRQEQFSFKYWEYFAFIWSSSDGLTVSINGTEVASEDTGSRNRDRTNNNYKKFTLGRSNSAGEGYILACYDDVIVIVPDANEQLPTPADLYGDPECTGYPTANELFNVTDGNNDVEKVQTRLYRDRNKNDDASVETTDNSGQYGYIAISVANDTEACLNSPDMCTNGVTMSFWMKPMSFANLADSNTNPDGYGYILSSGPSGDKGFILKCTRSSMNFIVNDGQTVWDASMPTTRLSRVWTNIALSWSQEQGPRVLINGLEPYTTVNTTSLSTTAAPHSFNKLHLGKRNDANSGYFYAAYDDLAVWYKVLEFSDPNVVEFVYGEDCHEVLITTNHAELDAMSVWTGTIECDNQHASGCSRDLDELYEMTIVDDVLSAAAYEIAISKLNSYVQPRTYMTLDELEVSSEILNKLLHHTLPNKINDTAAEDDLQTVMDVSSNLLESHRTGKWKSVHQSHPGATMMMKDIEAYAMDVVKRMRDENGRKADLNVTLTSDNLIMNLARFDIADYDPQEQFTFPVYADGRLSSIDTAWNNPQDSITLPKNIFDFTIKNTGKASIVSFLYETIDDVLPEYSEDENLQPDSLKVNSRVLSLLLDPELREDLYNPIEIVLQHSEEKLSGEESLCAFWDFNMPNTISGGWNTSGCDVHRSYKTQTICHCYHLTHFTTVKQPKALVIESRHDKILRIITWVGIVLSMLTLILLLAIYVGFRPLRRVHHMIHINLIVAMLLAKLCVIVVLLSVNNKNACKTMAVFLHFFYTASFSWMLVDGIHLLVEIKVTLALWFRERLRYYLLIGWGLPAMIVGISLGVTIDGYGASNSCLFSIKEGAMWGFVGPCFLIIIANCWILVTVMRNTNEDDPTQKIDKLDSRKSSLRANAVLLPLLGITWIFGALYVGEVHLVLRYFFVILNSLQGLFIFLLHGLGSSEVRLVGKAIITRKDVEKEIKTKLKRLSMTKEEQLKQIEEERKPPPKPAYFG